MWRSFFLAVGIFGMILGAETLVVDHAILASNRRIPTIVAGQSADNASGRNNVFSNNAFSPRQNTPYQGVGYGAPNYRSSGQIGPPKRVFKTKDWMPWSLLATGAIVVMYTYSLPGKQNYSEKD